MKNTIKNLFVLFTILMMTTVGISASGGGGSSTTLFEDDFESGIIDPLKWTVVDSPEITNEMGFVHNGLYAALFNGGPNPDDQLLSISIDTTDQKDIELSYARMTISLEPSDDYFRSEYSTDSGETWTVIEEITGDNSYAINTLTLPETANNNPNVQVRFGIKAAASGSNPAYIDYAALDDVLVTGFVANPPEILSLGHEPLNPTDNDAVTICAEISHGFDLVGVTLNYDFHDEIHTGSEEMVEESEDVFCFTFLAEDFNPSDNTKVTYTVTAEDTYGSVDEEEDEFVYDGLPPTANAGGPYICDEGSSVELDGSASDDNVDQNLDFAWDFNEDGIIDSTEEKPMFSCVDDSVNTVSLTVTDNVGNENTDYTTVTVNNILPTADAGGPYTCSEGETVLLDASGSSDPVDDLVLYEWDLDYDGQLFNVDQTGETYLYQCGNGLTEIDIAVKVTDDDGGESTATTTIIVTNNEAPVIQSVSAVPNPVDEGSEVTLTVEFSDYVEDTHTATVNWGDGNQEVIDPAVSQLNVLHTYVDDGEYLVTVTVDDGEDSDEDTTLTIVVDNVNPEILSMGVASGEAYTGIQNEEICFSAEATDQGVEDELTYEWNFGDEGYDTDVNCHVWEDDFDGTVTLRVEDGDGGFDEEEVSVKVYNYGLELNEGMNLISIPLVPEDSSVEAVLNEVEAEVVWAYKYNPETEQNEWYYFPPEAPEGVGNLAEMEPGYGYYVNMEEGDVLYNNGDKFRTIGQAHIPMPPQVTLTTGWNLIGHYGLNQVDKDDELQDLSGGLLTDLASVTLLGEDALLVEILESGEGYWAFITGQDNMLYAPSEADYSDEEVC